MLTLWQILYWLGTLADWYTTKRLVLDKEAAKEMNPPIAWLIEKLEKPGKEDMIDFGFQKMHKAEIALLLLKVGMGIVMHVTGTPVLVWACAAMLLLLVSASNKFNLLGKLIRWWKK